VFTVDKNFHVNFVVAANITGVSDLGFAGPLAEEIAGNDAIQALPQWRLPLGLGWYWTLQNRDAIPHFTVSNATTCVGRILGHMLYDVLNEANKALGPLSEVIGPSGILLKPVPATKFIFGRVLTVAELMEVVADSF